MNKKELVIAMRKEGMSGVVVKRIERLLDRYATIDSFFSASKGSIMSEYSKINFGGKHSLGKSFWSSFDKANEIFRGGTRKEKPSRDIDEPGAVMVDSKDCRMMTLEQLKTVVSFMELCDVEAMNILEITGFLGAVRMRQKKPEANSESNASASLEEK